MLKYDCFAHISRLGGTGRSGGSRMDEEKNEARIEVSSTAILVALAASVAAVAASALALAEGCASAATWVALAASFSAAAFIVADVAPRRRRRSGAIGRIETAELCRLFVEHSPVYIFFKDDKLRNLLLSRNYEKSIGKKLEDMLGKTSEAMFGPELGAMMDASDRKILLEGKPFDETNEAKGRVYRTLAFPLYRRGRPAYLAGFTLDITEQKRAEEKALQSLREKETLIRELYHRTKNTLQVVRSMLELQAEEYPGSDSARRLVKDAEDRIQAISLVHQMLYENRDLSNILIKDYVSELAALVYRSFGVSEDRISLDLEVAERSLALETAVPVGLILNELMTNSMKHAFPNRRSGEIRILLANEGPDAFVLRYSDDGVGVPPGFDFLNRDTLGLKLIRSIGAQINGEVSFEASRGVACSIAFKAQAQRA
jgi:PAS domain S-box-containing protein